MSSYGRDRRPRGGRDHRDPDAPVGSAELARAGFADGGRAASQLSELLGRFDPVDGQDTGTSAPPVDPMELVTDLGATADPDAALLLLVRLLDPRSTGADGGSCAEHVRPVLTGPVEDRRRLLHLLGGSLALGEHLLQHPEHVTDVARPLGPEPREIVEAVRDRSALALRFLMVYENAPPSSKVN